jgi:hypothetical protein
MRFVNVMCLVFLSTALANTQCVKGDCYSGTGTFIFNSGATYTGQFIKGKIQGKGRCEFTNGNIYYGEWHDQFIEGVGTMKYNNGDVYIGQFIKGRINGTGQMQYSNGSNYNGNWKNNLRHGSGKLTTVEGQTIAGKWIEGSYNNANPNAIPISANTANSLTEHSESLRDCNKTFCRSGYGNYTYRDGSIYTGTFVDGLPEGKGVCHYGNGDIYEGGWKNHGPDGEGIMNFNSGRVYAALWNNGKLIKELSKKEKVRVYTNKELNENVIESADINIFAVVVGVANYNHMPRLKYTDDDAYQIYAFLKSPEGGAIPDSQIKVLVDEDATREKILETMTKTFWKADDNDVIILYFSGHGLEGNFLPFDFDGYNNKLAHEEVIDIFNNSKAKHKVCFADACYSGSLAGSKSPYMHSLANYFDRFNKVKGGTAVLTSSKSEEVSMEFSGLRQGVFSHFLIRGLKGEADADHNRVITISELYNFVFKGVREYTFNDQTPTLSGDYDRNMPIGNIRD